MFLNSALSVLFSKGLPWRRQALSSHSKLPINKRHPPSFSFRPHPTPSVLKLNLFLSVSKGKIRRSKVSRESFLAKRIKVELGSRAKLHQKDVAFDPWHGL